MNLKKKKKNEFYSNINGLYIVIVLVITSFVLFDNCSF